MKKKLTNMITLLLLISGIGLVSAQQKTVSGTVTDASQVGRVLPGVNILLKGTKKGTQADFDGKYSIRAKKGDVLIFSFQGLKTIQKIVGDANTINVVMQQDEKLLDEVVVVGYGTSTKKSFTGTAKIVKQKLLDNKNTADVSKSLVGEAAGVNVINISGQPGRAATIRIRGFGSLNGNRDPLYVVDGVPFSSDEIAPSDTRANAVLPSYGNSISAINPSDIQNITILKDAAATAIYGSRGANGVILITTKSGKYGKSSIEIDNKVGVNFSLIPRYEVIKSPEEYIETSWEALGNAGVTLKKDYATYANKNLFSGKGINKKYNLWDVADAAALIDPATGKIRSGVARKYNPENWLDHGFQTSIRNETNLKMSGGSDKTKYFSSLGYLDDKGYILNSDYKRYSVRLNLTNKTRKWLTTKTNIGYSYAEQNTNGQSRNSGSIFWFVDNLPPIYPLFERDAKGKLIPDKIYGGNVYDYGNGRGFGALTNAVADAIYNKNYNERYSFDGNFSFNIRFSDNLSFETKYGVQYYSRISNVINNPFYGSAAGADQKGYLFKTNREALTQNILNIFRYNQTFGDHTLAVLAAHETNQWKRKVFWLSKSRIVNLNAGLDDPSNYVKSDSNPEGYTENTALESYFGQINYSLKSTYFLSGSIRRDGSSRFAKDKWGTFWSAGLGWVISNESFMNSVDFINYLKLKVSYGVMGDQAGVDYYSGRNGYDTENLGDQISLTTRAIVSPDLTWETSKMFQSGLEFALFDNVVSASLDYYLKNTSNLIFSKRLGPSIGDGLIVVNDGKLKNSGFEFDITTHLINKKDYTLDLSINGELPKNELTAMPIDPATGKEKILDQATVFGRSVGHSIYDFYMREWAGVDTEDGRAMWNIYYIDTNGNGKRDVEDAATSTKAEEVISSLTEYQAENPNQAISKTTTKTYAEATEKYVDKSAIPVVRGAFRLSGRVKAFDFSTQFTYQLGGYAYDGAYASLMANDQIGNNNWHVDIKKSWKKKGDITNVPKLESNEHTSVNSLSTRFLTSSNYIALNNIKVGYTLSGKFLEKTGIDNLNIWLSGDNMFLFSDRKGFNPSTSETGNTSTYRYAPLTTITLGVRVKF